MRRAARKLVRYQVTQSSFEYLIRGNPLLQRTSSLSFYCRGGNILDCTRNSSSSGVRGSIERMDVMSILRNYKLFGQSFRRNFNSSKDKHEKDDIRDTENVTKTTETPPEGVEGGAERQQQHEDQQKYLWTTAEAVRYATKHHLDDIGKAYGNIELTLMSKINESNQRRFRAVLFGGVGAIVWVLFVFGTDIKNWLSGQTAGIAKETLENEQLKIQTQELATAVIQTILNDKEIAAQASKFLQEASGNKETQDALVKLTVQVLRHPDSLKETVELVKKVINNLHDDQQTIQKLGVLFAASISEPKVKSALVELIGELTKDPDVLTAVEELASKVILKPEVYDATAILLGKSTQDILRDGKVIDQSRDFVADVMGDDRLQRKTGTALFNTFSHAISPSVTRCIGAGLVISAVAVVQIALSPW